MPPGSPSSASSDIALPPGASWPGRRAQCVKKGQRILVEGEVDASVWVDAKDGSAHAALELTAAAVRFLGPSGAATTGLSEREEQSEGCNKELPSGGEDTEDSSLFETKIWGQGSDGSLTPTS